MQATEPNADVREQEIIDRDVADLRQLGYTQELKRVMGSFSNFAISFSIISVLTGAVILYGFGLKYGGPGINGIGWPIVSVFTLCIAAAMAEVASAYPTAGGLYYWASRMGNRHWGWWTAWLNLGGLITAVAGINWAAAAFFDRIVLQEFFGIAPTLDLQVWTMAAITLVQVLINTLGIGLVARLNDVSVWIHVAGVVVIAAALLIAARYRNGFGYAFLIQPGDPGIAANPPFWGAFGIFGAFLLGLLQAQWTYTGYDASAHTAEETIDARRASARGIFMSVLVSAVVGYVLLLAITWALPPVSETLVAEGSGTPAVAYTLMQNLGDLGLFLSFVIVIAMMLCGMSAVASTGRMIFAFARDGGVPAAGFFSRVNPVHRTPTVAIVTAGVIAVAICAVAQFTDDPIVSIGLITAMSTNLLYWAYGAPVLLGLRSGEWRGRARWSLGGASRPVAVIALGWIGVISVLFLWRPDNAWAFNGTAAFLALLLVYWLVWARTRFAGPPALASDDR